MRRLRGEAAEILRAAGHPASDATLERLASTLQAAAGTEEARSMLRAGRLTEDVEPLGFAAFEGAVPRRSSRRAKARVAPTPRPNRQLEKARAELAAARAEAEAAQRVAKEAEREAERASRAAERAAERVARLESRVKQLAGRSA